MTDHFDKATRSRIMSKIRSKGTKPELLLVKLLKTADLRFSTHAKLPGTPDIAFKQQKVAVFVDGEFWHGYNWKHLGRVPPKGYWRKKLQRNISRDKRVNRELHCLGWSYIRLWESQVLRKPAYCLNRIRRALKRRN